LLWLCSRQVRHSLTNGRKPVALFLSFTCN